MAGFPGFRIGIMEASFHKFGMEFDRIERLKRSVRAPVPSGPRWRRWRYEIPSGPLAVELPARLIASETITGVKGGGRKESG